MAIIKWSPFLEPFQEMDKIMSDFESKGFAPAINVYETKDAVVVEAALAGINSDDVEVSIENDILTIKGESKHESEVDDKNYYRKEVRAGSFYRSVALPAHVQGDRAEAESREGMLRITVPKTPEVQPKTIKIKKS